jgi:hypothetical protein
MSMDITIRKISADRFLVTAGTDPGREWLSGRLAEPEQSGTEACKLYGEALRIGLRIVYHSEHSADSNNG